MHLDGKLSVRIKVGIARLRLLLLSRAIIGQATTDAQMSKQGSSSNVQGGCSQTTLQTFIEAEADTYLIGTMISFGRTILSCARDADSMELGPFRKRCTSDASAALLLRRVSTCELSVS